MRILVFFVLCLTVVAKKRYDGHRMVVTFPKTADDLEVLFRMQDDVAFEEIDFWAEPSRVRPTAVRVSPNDFERFHDKLQEAGIEYDVRVENIQLDIDQEEEAMRQTRQSARNYCNFYTTYCTLTEVNEIINMFETNYPNNVQVDTIGTSLGGRAIRRVKIAEDFNLNKPAIYLEAATHAREWITVSGALYMIDKLARAESDETQFMLSRYDWYVIVVHNPDGYEHSHTSDRMWRKNRYHCNGNTYGVDLNRNYDISFGGLGTSSNCGSNIYHGPGPFSERETTAIRDAIIETGQVFAFFAIHSYGEMLIVPFAYDYVYPDRYPELKDVATAMKDEILVNGGPNYAVGTSWEILYPAAGGSDDYFYCLGVPYSYTYELQPSSSDPGFLLNATLIPWAIEDLFVSLWRFATLQLDWSDQPDTGCP